MTRLLCVSGLNRFDAAAIADAPPLSMIKEVAVFLDVEGARLIEVL